MATLVVNPLSRVQNSLQVAINPLIPCHLPNALFPAPKKFSLLALTPNSTCTDPNKENSTKNSQETTLTPQIPLLARPRLHVHTLYWFATIPKQPEHICELNNVFWGLFDSQKHIDGLTHQPKEGANSCKPKFSRHDAKCSLTECIRSGEIDARPRRTQRERENLTTPTYNFYF